MNYVERIPRGPFDGHLDVHFKGLGTIAGDFAAKETNDKHRPKGCTGPQGTSQFGELEGSIEFHGGGFAPWTASHAYASLERSPRLACRPGAAKHEHKPKTLFDYIDENFGSFSGWRYALQARLRRPHRVTYLSVYGYEKRPRPQVNFDASTYGWLPGWIATDRIVDRAVPGRTDLQASHGGYHPARATLRPPRPYSGVGTYSRATPSPT